MQEEKEYHLKRGTLDGIRIVGWLRGHGIWATYDEKGTMSISWDEEVDPEEVAVWDNSSFLEIGMTTPDLAHELGMLLKNRGFRARVDTYRTAPGRKGRLFHYLVVGEEGVKVPSHISTDRPFL